MSSSAPFILCSCFVVLFVFKHRVFNKFWKNVLPAWGLRGAPGLVCVHVCIGGVSLKSQLPCAAQ